ncbi:MULTISPECIES: thioredoxin family protein [environmental samples]|jgi:small redox-active disulfide protein 2|uniref:thioredoxin family protein n=1 Tax=environmental samples TaxID=876090 RepID=UPI000337B32B|nr:MULTISPECIES: thioredoxin family protein [environmental samples]CDC71774.1 putative uncharacterized protein [Oscillibacter sp. CAG:155]
MWLFGKKKETCKTCGCGNPCGDKPAEQTGTGASVRIQVLGSGCAKCNALEEAVREALAELKIDAEIQHVTDFTQIAAYGVMTTPALAVEGKVVSCGKVLKKEEVEQLLQDARR